MADGGLDAIAGNPIGHPAQPTDGTGTLQLLAQACGLCGHRGTALLKGEGDVKCRADGGRSATCDSMIGRAKRPPPQHGSARLWLAAHGLLPHNFLSHEK